MGLLQELQRRKVVRTTIAYLAAAFVTAQAVQLLVDGLELPSWILKAVLIALVVALPAVIGLAWAFDLTSEGVEKTYADPGQSKVALPWKRIALPLTASLLLLIVIVAFISLNRPSKAALDQKLIAVMPFRVSGDPQMGYLRDGMVDLLAAKLTGEGGPRAVDPRAVLSAVKRESADAELDERQASAIGERLGAGRVLIGSVVGGTKQLQISAKILDAADGRVIAEGTEPGTADSLLATVDRLVAKLLSLQAGEGPQRLDLLTTTSLPALRAYLDGQAAFRNGRFANAIELFGRALDHDSTFALAAMGQWIATGWGEGPRVDYPRLRRILRANSSRLNAVDKLFAYALANGDKRTTIEEELSDFEAVIKAAPDRADAWFEYADHMVHWGPVASHMDALERADAAFSRVLQIDSTYLPALLHRMDVSFLQGRRDEYARLEPVRRRLDPTGNAAQYQISWRAHILGDSAALRAERAALDTMSSQRAWLVTFIGIVGSGAVSDAVKAIDRNVAASATSAERRDALSDGAAISLMYGMPARAARMYDELITIADDPLPVHETQILAALYEHGDTVRAARSARALENALVHETRMAAGMRAACALGQWQAWHGDTPSLRALLDRLGRVPADSAFRKMEAEVCASVLATIAAVVSNSPDLKAKTVSLDRLLQRGPRIPGRYMNASNLALARAAERSGDRKLAYRAISRLTFHPDAFLLSSTMFRESARLAALNGDRARAITNYTLYLNMQEAAEPSVRPEVEAARKHLAEISGERR